VNKQNINELEDIISKSHLELEEIKVSHQKLKNTLADKESIILALSQHSLDLTFIFNEQLQMIYASPSVSNLTEYSVEEILKGGLDRFFHPDDLKLVNKIINTAIEKPAQVVSVPDHRVRHHDLRWLYFEGSAAYMREVGASGGVVFNCHDVTQRKKQEQTIHRKANYDTLTELPNRHLFLDRLSQETGVG
jgi:PAS domain S-box-containing protein